MRAVNLIPADQRGGSGPLAGRSQGAAYALLGLIGGLALLALLYGMAHRQISSRKAQAASLSARAQQAQATAAQLAPYTNFIALREERAQAVAQLVDARFDWAHALRELGRVLPRSASITTLDGQVGQAGANGSSGAGGAKAPAASSAGTGAGSTSGARSTAAAGSTSGAGSTAAASSVTPPGSVPVFTLGGCATSQAQVALTLNRLRLVDGVSEVTLQNSTEPNPGSSGGGAGGGCPGSSPTFAIQVTFDPLPSTSAARAASVSRAAFSGGSR